MNTHRHRNLYLQKVYNIASTDSGGPVMLLNVGPKGSGPDHVCEQGYAGQGSPEPSTEAADLAARFSKTQVLTYIYTEAS